MKHNPITMIAVFMMSATLVTCKNSREPITASNLRYEDAQIRKSLIDSAHYDLYFDLTSEERFFAKSKILFHLKRTEDTKIDFDSGEISKLSINGQEKTRPEIVSGSIQILKTDLRIGENEIEVIYSKPFSRNGTGLHKFVDPEDHSIYFYTQFEAYHANKVFPCFDQPDIKADFTMKLKVPKDFTAKSATNPIVKTDGEFLVFDFPKSKIFSTYLFSIIAGPYTEWKSNYKSIQLGLLARKSMAKYVKSAEWFLVTKQGFQFFENYFSIPYPFDKYDQIIVPEFNSGAMENIGAVTFSERFLSRGELTQSQKENTANVILHEMAHVWFGNLVTMKWWNDLWLNESFATYMASLAQFQATEYKESWVSFLQKMKNWALKEDQLSTTHPIEATIKDTNEAFTNFDGITYGKGASVLKQLAYYVGEDQFRDGVREYLKENSFKNAQLIDFLGAIEKKSKHNLKIWSSQWLQNAGVNEVKVSFNCSDEKITDFKIVQSNAKNSMTLRQHKFEVQLLNLQNNDSAIHFDTLGVTYQDSETFFKELVKRPCPDFVLLNSGDYDYGKFELDEKSIKNIGKILSLLTEKDDLKKSLIWSSYWNLVLDRKISLNSYSEFTIPQIEKEKSEKILRLVLPTLHSDSGISYYTSLHWTHPRKEKQRLENLREFYWKNLNDPKFSSDSKKIWFYGYVSLADENSPENKLVHLLEEKLPIENLKIDQDMRWNMLLKLSSGNLPMIKEMVFQEKQKDQSMRGVEFSLMCEAASPSMEKKEKFLQILSHSKNQFSNSTLRMIANSLFPIGQKSLQNQLSQKILGSLSDVEKFRDESFVSVYVKTVFNTNCEKKSIDMIQKYISSRKDIRPGLKKNLLNLLDSENMCILVRKKNETDQKIY